jgi:hypothetical protein
MTGSIALLVTWLAATSLASAMRQYYISVVSPFEPFLMAGDANYFRMARAYWTSLAISHLAGWIFLGWSAWRLRTFVDKGKKSGMWERVLTWNLAGRGGTRRVRLLDVNPVLWLLDDSRRLRWVTWTLSLAAVGLLIFMSRKMGPASFFFGGWVMWPFYFLLKVFFAIAACRFFGESRRTRSLELLCCTPMTMRAIIQGQWMMLRRVFMWPVIVLLSAHLAALLFSITSNSHANFAPGVMGIFLCVWQFRVIPNNAADFMAIGWFGMWLALSLRRPNMAAGLTILCVVILPPVAFCIPTLAIDAIFIVIGWVKLLEDFRLRGPSL